MTKLTVASNPFRFSHPYLRSHQLKEREGLTEVLLRYMNSTCSRDLHLANATAKRGLQRWCRDLRMANLQVRQAYATPAKRERTPKNRATCESCRVTRAAFSQSFHGHLLPQAADLIPRIYAMGRSSICQSIDCNLRGHSLSTRSARKQSHPAHCPLQAMASRHLKYRLRCTSSSSSSSSQERLRSFPTQSNPPSNPKCNSFLEGSHRLKVLGTAERSIPTATEEILQL